MPKWVWKMALNAKTKRESDSKTHEWAWRMALNAKLRKIVNQNAWMRTKNGSEHQKLKIVAQNAWMGTKSDSKCQN